MVEAAKNKLYPKDPNLAVHHGAVSKKEARRRFNEIYLSNQYSFVRVVTPFYRGGRLTAQQGVFTCVGDVKKDFMKNFSKMKSDCEIVKYIIPGELRMEFLYQLYSANIGKFSLFAGLDGFSETLKTYHPLVWETNSFRS